MKVQQMNAKRNVKSNTDSDESNLAQERMGRNSLQGDDQLSVRNERHAVPDVKPDADDIIESFEKRDKDKRAREGLNKGARRGDAVTGDTTKDEGDGA